MPSYNHTIRIGVSSCLLGENVRYDGRNSANSCIADILAQDFELLGFCPEVGIGLGVPRAAIQVTLVEGHQRLLGVADHGLDVTDALKRYAMEVFERLNTLSGYIFKTRSPSCGLANVEIYDLQGRCVQHGAGIFAQTITGLLPDLPVIDEEALMDPDKREHFIRQTREYHRLGPRTGP